MPTEFKEFDYNDIFKVTDKDGVKYLGWSKSDDLLNPELIIMPDSGRVETLEDDRIFDSWKILCSYGTVTKLTQQQNDELFKCVYSIIRYFMTPEKIRTKLYSKFRKSIIKKIEQRQDAYIKNIKKQTKTINRIAFTSVTRDRFYALDRKRLELKAERAGEYKALPYVLIPLYAVLKKQGRENPTRAIINLINNLPNADFKATDSNIYDYLK